MRKASICLSRKTQIRALLVSSSSWEVATGEKSSATGPLQSPSCGKAPCKALLTVLKLEASIAGHFVRVM